MEPVLVIALVVVAAVMGGVVGWLVCRRSADAQLAAAHIELAEVKATLQANEAAFGDRLAAAVLDASRQVGADLADQNSRDAAARLEVQKASLQDVVGGVQAKLEELGQSVTKAGTAQVESTTKLLTQLGNVTTATGELRERTGQLTSALTGGSTRGRWGEFQLQRIIEVAGLTPHVTWQTQVQENSGKGAQRPDLLIHIPDSRVLVVDAKAPALVFDEDAADAPTDETYAKLLRGHIKALSKKDYVEGIPNAVGHVFLFLPSEAAYAGALRADPGMLEFAADNRVAVVAPSTLLSALTVVTSVWTQFEANKHTEEAIEQARQLHKRLGVFAGHLTKVGVGLDKVVKDFNKAVGSLERQVYPAARRMEAANMAQAGVVFTVDPVDIDGVRSIEAGDNPDDPEVLRPSAVEPSAGGELPAAGEPDPLTT